MTFEEWWAARWPTNAMPAVMDSAFMGLAQEAWEAATKAEREACAKVCDRQAELQEKICSGDDVINQAKRCARDIRSRNGR